MTFLRYSFGAILPPVRGLLTLALDLEIEIDRERIAVGDGRRRMADNAGGLLQSGDGGDHRWGGRR